MSTFQRHKDELLGLLTRAARVGVLDAHGHLHSPDDGKFIEMGGGLDPLGLAARAGRLLLGPSDTLEGSARHDGHDGALVAAVVREKGGERTALLSTVKTPAVADWAAEDEENSIAYVDGETAGDLVKALTSVTSGRSSAAEVSGVDLGDVFFRRSADGESGIEVSVLAYPLLPSHEAEYVKDRRVERRDLVREQQARPDPADEDPDDPPTPAEVAAWRAGELAEFDAETERDLAELAARREAHTVRFSAEQADALTAWLRSWDG